MKINQGDVFSPLTVFPIHPQANFLMRERRCLVSDKQHNNNIL